VALYSERAQLDGDSLLNAHRAGGRWLEAAVQGTPGRALTVQLGSAASSAQPTDQLQVQAGNVQGAMLEPSAANKNWVRFLHTAVACSALCCSMCRQLRHMYLAFMHLIGLMPNALRQYLV